MLLVIDIGNSNITFGFFENAELKNTARTETDKELNLEGHKENLKKVLEGYEKKVTAVSIGSVVPELDEVFSKSIESITTAKPFFIDTKIKTNIRDFSCTTNELGADRLCDVVAAIKKIDGNRVVVDLGTATKFEVVSEKDEYLGGAIGPGVGDSFRSLLSHASKLPDIRLTKPKKVVAGWSTQEHLDSGFVYGFASLIDGMIDRVAKEQKWKNYAVILTGGFSELIAPFVTHKHTLDKDLNLFGLKILWEINN